MEKRCQSSKVQQLNVLNINAHLTTSPSTMCNGVSLRPCCQDHTSQREHPAHHLTQHPSQGSRVQSVHLPAIASLWVAHNQPLTDPLVMAKPQMEVSHSADCSTALQAAIVHCCCSEQQTNASTAQSTSAIIVITIFWV